MLSTSFRNTLIASTLLVGASILVSPAAFAQDSGQVGGTIETVNELTFTAPVDLSADLTSGTLGMGSLTIRNNDPDGWTLQVRSANAGKLHRSTGSGITDIAATTYIPYTALTATGAPSGATTTSLATITGTDANFVVAPYSVAFADSDGDAITISATLSNGTFGGDSAVARAGMPAGEYKDTLYFTLTSN